MNDAATFSFSAAYHLSPVGERMSCLTRQVVSEPILRDGEIVFQRFGVADRASGQTGPSSDELAVVVSPLFSGWVDLSRHYEWGCQPATAYARYTDGHAVELVCGLGDDAPYPRRDGSGFTSCAEEAQEFELDCQDADRRLDAEYGAYLRESYRRGINPLPGLRRRAGGVWSYARKGVQIRLDWEGRRVSASLPLPDGGHIVWQP